MKERLQKILSSRGIASRREAEQIIAAGRVTVGGVPAILGQSADPESELIEIDGKPLSAEPAKVYIMLNKPRGYVTTMSDEKGRNDVTALVKDCPAHVWPVGRLDMESEGLLIMTNDGALTYMLTHPSNEKKKTYEVLVRGDIEKAIKPLSEQMDIDGYMIKPAEVRLLKKTKDGALLSVTIHEGRNRQVRKMCSLVHLHVLSLIRVAEGGITLGDLKRGAWRYLSDEEISLLKHKNAGLES